MTPRNFVFVMAALLMTGCATTHTADHFDVQSFPETQQARDYQKNGDYEEAIESYRQLIAANPKHFKSVLYQHEIMKATEALSDPYLLIDEINRTVQMFLTAHDESFEGATPEALEHEQKSLINDINKEGKMYYSVYQSTHHEFYLSISKEIFTSSSSLYTDNIDTCEYNYAKANVYYYGGNYKEAGQLFENVLDNCDNGKLFEHPKNYLDAAHGYLLAYDHIKRELINADDPSCPQIEERYDINGEPNIQEIPIAECDQNIIKASNRFSTILDKYPDEKLNTIKPNAQHHVANIYYDHNQFDKAIPLFEEVIHRAPKTEIAI